MKRPAVFFHCYQVGPPDACAGGWRWGFWDACIKLMASGLSEAADCDLVLVGDDDQRRWLTQPTTEPLPWLSKVPWLNPRAEYNLADNEGWYEMRTIRLLWEDAAKHHENPVAEPYPILYCHTKGALTENLAVHLWREYMQAFLIEDWRRCVSFLMTGGFKTCGVDLKPFGGWHYSGNFWWARSDYIASLPDPQDRSRWTGEPRMWSEYYLLQNGPEGHYSLWNSGYDDLYRSPLYRKDYVHALRDPLP